jgi:hypothetical protein
MKNIASSWRLFSSFFGSQHGRTQAKSNPQMARCRPSAEVRGRARAGRAASSAAPTISSTYAVLLGSTAAVLVRVRASCGGVTLECFASRRPFYAACQAISADAGPSFDDKSGSCVVEGLAGDTFACGSVAPEPKEPESSEENNR